MKSNSSSGFSDFFCCSDADFGAMGEGTTDGLVAAADVFFGTAGRCVTLAGADLLAWT